MTNRSHEIKIRKHAQKYIFMGRKCYEHSSLLGAYFGYTPTGIRRLLKRAEKDGLEVIRKPSLNGVRAYANKEQVEQYLKQYLLTAVERAKRWLLSQPELEGLSQRELDRAAKRQGQSFGLVSIQAALRLLGKSGKPPTCAQQLMALCSEQPRPNPERNCCHCRNCETDYHCR